MTDDGFYVTRPLRSLKYLPSGEVQFKVNIIKDYTGYTEPKPLHTAQLPIQPSKWKHFQDLKPAIPLEYDYFYDNLIQMESK